MTARGTARPHEGWADVYDLVLERTFGPTLAAFTDATVAVVRDHLSPPARVVDFGAGTGRVSIPLAALGYDVTAVEPAKAMLGRLAEKEASLGAVSRITRVISAMEDFCGARDHDLALCVFSVIGYLLEESALDGAFRGMASSLGAAGLALIDVPGPEVMEGFEVESDDVLRHVEIEPDPDNPGLHSYLERTAVAQGGRIRRFEERFRIRAWTRREVLDSAARAGFALEADLTHRFAEWGSGYLLLRRIA